MGENLQSKADSGPLRVAAIGLGWVTQNRHLPVMARQKNIDLVGVIDRHPNRAAEVASRLGLRKHAETGNLRDVSWLDEVDAITVGTAPFSHFDLVSEALELGKHVLTEKPFTMSRHESDALIGRRDAAARTLAIVHNFQFARSTNRLIADLDAGKLGQVASIDAVQFGNPARRLPEWYEDLPMGLFYDESPHLLYLLRRIAPNPLEFLQANWRASTLGHKTPARIDAQYAFNCGGKTCPATLSCNFESPVSEWYLMVFGTKRLGIVDVFRDVYICLPNDGAHVTSTVLRTSLSATWQHWMQHIPSGWGHLRKTLVYGNDEVFRRFAAAAIGGRQPEGISAEDARDVQHMQADIVERAVELGAKN
jgi:scyllo-inositol 2-dehydrogenase (NADP+)